ncbi:prolipoprotein diacylglyceryl transferase [Ammonicoccus fulvus]|uniref:Phosphatidylglycerol--prolipoprotein diacylglyceryl transferase n=1 Tax=Ammonicoccus fulvus TaxID=3138240 RepID=A0ABZ3FMX1_9ACTN
MSPLVLQWPEIDPVAFRIGPLSVHWYALMYLLAFGVGYLLLRRRLHHQPYARITSPEPWKREHIEDLLFVAITGVIVGGRLGYCLFYKPEQYLRDPLSILYLWEGGMSFHGGAIGVALGLLIYAWRKKRPFLEVTDLLVPAAPLGLAAGRLGNFINGELWGRAADPNLPWAMTFPAAGPDPRHPSQLYQFMGEGLLLAVLLWLYARKERARGQVSAMFLIGYGVFRFLAEWFREPDDFLGTLGLGLSMGQWLSVPMILGGIGLWLWAKRANIHPPAHAIVEDAEDATDERTPEERD